jgi:hypothetical protein
VRIFLSFSNSCLWVRGFLLCWELNKWSKRGFLDNTNKVFVRLSSEISLLWLLCIQLNFCGGKGLTGRDLGDEWLTFYRLVICQSSRCHLFGDLFWREEIRGESGSF